MPTTLDRTSFFMGAFVGVVAAYTSVYGTMIDTVFTAVIIGLVFRWAGFKLRSVHTSIREG